MSREIYNQFMSTTCPACGQRKPPRNGFCRDCYFSLPSFLSKPMWKRFLEGYEEAHKAALAWLKQHQKFS